MNKDQAILVFYIGKKIYHCGVYAPNIVESYQVQETSSDAFVAFITAILNKHSIQNIIFHFAIESLVVVSVPWSSDFLLHPKSYLQLFIHPILPDNHTLEDYYYWYDIPEYNREIPVIATYLAEVRDIQARLKTINAKIKFYYTNEISETLDNYAYNVKSFNAIIPSVNHYLAIATVQQNKRIDFLTILQYKEAVNTHTLDALKLFLMVKLPNWLENSANLEYRILVPNATIKPNYSTSTVTKKIAYMIFLGMSILLISMLIYLFSLYQHTNSLNDQKQQLVTQNQQLIRQTSVIQEPKQQKLLPLLQSIDTPAFQDIYIQKVSSNNLKDNPTSLLLSGKAASFLALDDYIASLKQDKRVVNVDIITSFEDKSTKPITINFEIKITLTNIKAP